MKYFYYYQSKKVTVGHLRPSLLPTSGLKLLQSPLLAAAGKDWAQHQLALVCRLPFPSTGWGTTDRMQGPLNLGYIMCSGIQIGPGAW